MDKKECLAILEKYKYKRGFKGYCTATTTNGKPRPEAERAELKKALNRLKVIEREERKNKVAKVEPEPESKEEPKKTEVTENE